MLGTMSAVGWRDFRVNSKSARSLVRGGLALGGLRGRGDHGVS
jgi:hypothetical protein